MCYLQQEYNSKILLGIFFSSESKTQNLHPQAIHKLSEARKVFCHRAVMKIKWVITWNGAWHIESAM